MCAPCITEVLFALARAGNSVPCVVDFARLILRMGHVGKNPTQSGAQRLAFVALLLLALPVLLTIQALLPLPRLADRKRTLREYNLHPL
jgi:hypothetical protein